MWEHQSAALGNNYHTARQNGAVTVRQMSYHITNHSVAEPVSLVHGTIITVNGIEQGAKYENIDTKHISTAC